MAEYDEELNDIFTYISKHNGCMVQNGIVSKKKKPKCCWTYIKKGTCFHTNQNFKEGRIIGGLWHPDTQEKNYLKNKVN